METAERDWLRGPSDADVALWAEVVRGVRPLPNRRAGAPAPKPAPQPKPQPTPTVAKAATRKEPARRIAPVRPPPPAPASVQARGLTGLDARRAERLRRGELEIEARLDLHGMTQAAAHRALDGFLGISLGAGRRCVLIITGKGSPRAAEPDGRFVIGDSPGILRARLPGWIDHGPYADRVVALQPAHRKHGGDGAFYVYLRRAR